MDEHCEDSSIPIKWLADSDVMIIHGKTSIDRQFRECVIMFGPSSKASKKTTRLEFLSYIIEDCGVTLAVQQSPKSTFGMASTTLVSQTLFCLLVY